MNITETMFSFLIKDEEEVTFAPHNNEASLLLCGEILRALDSFDEAREPCEVFAGVCVSSCGDNADFDVLAKKMKKAGYDGAVRVQGAPVFVEGHVSVESKQLQAG
jgi:hypothetical protein